MSTQETVKLTIELVVSNGDGDGELPDDDRFAQKLYDKLSLLGFAEQFVSVLGVKVVNRTGDLDNSGIFLSRDEIEEINDFLGAYQSYIDNRGYADMTSERYEKEMEALTRIRYRLDTL